MDRISIEEMGDLAGAMQDVAREVRRRCRRVLKERRAPQQPVQCAVLRDEAEKCGESFELACIGFGRCLGHFLVVLFFRGTVLRGACLL